MAPPKRHPNPSGHGATYVPDPKRLGTLKTVYVSPYTGQSFETRFLMVAHNKAFLRRMRMDFESLVRERTLGCNPWERLPGETPLAYRRFQTYMMLDQRTMGKVARIFGVNDRKVMEWAKGWHWKFRADLWDRNLEAEMVKEFEFAKRRSARNQSRLGQKLQQVAMNAAHSLLNNEERIEEMSGTEIAKLAQVGVQIERLANADPTSISEDRGQVRLVWEGPAPSWAPATIEGER